MSTEKTKVNGSCHCGFIKYKANIKIDPETGSISPANRCNCTFCTKMSTTNHNLDGPRDFELISPASADEVPKYNGNVKTCPRRFCPKCGVHVWMQGYYEYNGMKFDINTINLATIDQPQEGVDLSKVKPKYSNMLIDNPGEQKDVPYPHGMI